MLLCFIMQKKSALCFVFLWFATGSIGHQDLQFDCTYFKIKYGSSVVLYDYVIFEGPTIPHFSCNNAHKIDKVLFKSSSMEELPKQLFETFTNLRIANLMRSGIKYVNRHSLESARILRILDLSWNALEELTADCFSGANLLIHLILSFNNISSIDKTAFNSLSNLAVLVLAGNKLQALDSEVFGSLSALQDIYLEFNELQTIERNLFFHNVKLYKVSLQNNRISMVDQDAFTIGANTVVNTVELNNNNLTKLDMKKAKVKKLYVFNNTLEEIFLSPWMESVIAYDNNISSILLDNTSSKSLKTLHLNNNSITSIESIQHLDSLENLILSNNRIDTVNLTSFAKFTNLEKLELKQNFISNLQLGTFAQQESLKWIDLSYNNLDQFDFDILSSSTVLERIYLDGNRLKSMNHQFLKEKFPSLKEIGLTDNSWDCTYLIQLAWYCKKHSIGLITYHSAVGYITNHTNVEGILCYDDDNPLTNGNITMHPHDHNFESEDNTLHTLLRNVNENMRRFNDRHEYEANQTNKLDSNVYELANNNAELQKELSSLRQSLMKIQLTLMSNRTNSSAGMDNDELRRMIEQQGAEHLRGSSSGQGMIVTLAVMMCLMMGVIVFGFLKYFHRSPTVERSHYAKRDSSLATIMNDDI